MVEAVSLLHERRIVHSDLKPANFMIVCGRVKIIDFGIAKTINQGTQNIHRDTIVSCIFNICTWQLMDFTEWYVQLLGAWSGSRCGFSRWMLIGREQWSRHFLSTIQGMPYLSNLDFVRLLLLLGWEACRYMGIGYYIIPNGIWNHAVFKYQESGSQSNCNCA